MQYPTQQQSQQQQYGSGINRPVYQSNGWNNRIRPVSSIEEVRAALIDFDGSVFYFSDLSGKRIYTKQIGMDGAAQINMYELKEMPMMEQQMVDTSNFVTRGEFEELANRIKNYLTDSSLAERGPAAADNPVVQNPEVKSTTSQRSFDF